VTKVSKALGDVSHEDLLAIARRVLELGGIGPFVNAFKDCGREDDLEPPKKRAKRARKGKSDFDMARWAKRDIALWISYDGEKYCGFAEQRDDTEKIATVEARVFDALKKCCLITDRDSCDYSRCGRTDKGVSALSQVLGLQVRAQCRVEDGDALGFAPVVDHAGDVVGGLGHREQDYALMLNRVLPEDIRAVAWAPTPRGFSARFSAGARVYRYFFCGGYDVAAMRAAAARLVGDHDYRNFCKMDILHVKNFRRLIYHASISKSGSGTGADEAWCFEIRGQAFLWHMVRCIVAVLFLVGERKEEPSVIDALLDVETTARRPQYTMAPEEPLVLHGCEFNTLRPMPLPENLMKITDHYEAAVRRATVALARARNAVETTRGLSVRSADVLAFLDERKVAIPPELASRQTVVWGDAHWLLQAAKTARDAHVYVPLASRHGCQTYDEKVDALGGRKLLEYEESMRKRHEEPENDAFHDDARNFG